MVQQDFCKYCDRRHACKDAYQQLSKMQGPSVIYKVIAAFLLPIIVFIVSLTVFEKILAGLIVAKKLKIAVSFLAAVTVTTLVTLIVKAASKRCDKS